MSELKKVLILDDDEENLYTLNILLDELFNVDIHICNNVNEAMVILNRHKIDLILSDIMMPNLSGFDFADYLLLQNEFKNIPIFFVSAIHITKNVEERIYKHKNVLDIIAKPLSIDLVEEYLKDYLI